MGIKRQTTSLKLVLAEFEKDRKAISATTLVQRLGTQINKTTIYRLLERLVDDGVLHAIIGKNAVKWYAKCADACNKQHHYDAHPHFQCNTCHDIECLPIHIKIPVLENRIISATHVLIQGVCEDCYSSTLS